MRSPWSILPSRAFMGTATSWAYRADFSYFTNAVSHSFQNILLPLTPPVLSSGAATTANCSASQILPPQQEGGFVRKAARGLASSGLGVVRRAPALFRPPFLPGSRPDPARLHSLQPQMFPCLRRAVGEHRFRKQT